MHHKSTYSYTTRLAALCALLLLGLTHVSFAQGPDVDATTLEGEVATTTLEAAIDTASSAASILNQRPDFFEPPTTPEEVAEQESAKASLFERRPIDSLTAWNVIAYSVQQAVFFGIPATTIVLILLAPIIATLVSFVRVVIGLPTLELFVPIALAFALVSVGVTLGLIILVAVILASYVSKVILQSVSMMYFPKRSLSMLFLSLFVFAALTMAVLFELETAQTVSIFPVLILMLLGDSIVSIQLQKSTSETVVITGMTILIGIVGYVMATSLTVQLWLLLYPELLFLVVPANILIGRYFGLRVSEYFRFKAIA